MLIFYFGVLHEFTVTPPTQTGDSMISKSHTLLLQHYVERQRHSSHILTHFNNMRGSRRPPKMPTVTTRPSSPRALNAARAATTTSTTSVDAPLSARAALCMEPEPATPRNELQRQVARLLDQYLDSVLTCDDFDNFELPTSPIQTNDDSFRLFVDSKPGNLLIVSKKRRADDAQSSVVLKRSRVATNSRISSKAKRKIECSPSPTTTKSAASSVDEVSSISSSDSEVDPEEMARLESVVYHVNVGPSIDPPRT